MTATTRQVDAAYPTLRAAHVRKATDAFKDYFQAQADVIVPNVQAGIISFDLETWTRRLHKIVYDVGMDTATEFGRTVWSELGRSRSLRFDPVPMSGWISAVAFGSARGINSRVEDAVFDAAVAGVVGDAALAVEALFVGLVSTRSGVYGSTQTTTFANFGAQEGAKAGGAGVKIWQTDIDPRDAHAVMAGERRPITGTFSNGMRWPGDPAGGPAQTVNCFPAGTLVDAEAAVGSYRRWYDGDLVVIRTAGGHELSGTPNHPVLTVSGWQPLGALDEGVDVVCGTLDEGVGIDDPDVVDRPTRIEQVHDAVARVGSLHRVPGRLVDFHGDGVVDGEVQVVRADCQLRDDRVFPDGQPSGHLTLAIPDQTRNALLVNGLGAQFIERRPASAPSLVRRDRVSLPFVGGEAGHPDTHGLALSTDRHVGVNQAATDRGTGHPEVLGDRLFGFARDVPADDLVVREPDSVGHPGRSAPFGFATLAEDRVQPVGADVELVEDVSDRGAGPVLTDQIVAVERRRFVGHVYNLETESGWYVANGIVVHNCRCWISFDE